MTPGPLGEAPWSIPPSFVLSRTRDKGAHGDSLVEVRAGAAHFARAGLTHPINIRSEDIVDVDVEVRAPGAGYDGDFTISISEGAYARWRIGVVWVDGKPQERSTARRGDLIDTSIDKAAFQGGWRIRMRIDATRETAHGELTNFLGLQLRILPGGAFHSAPDAEIAFGRVVVEKSPLAQVYKHFFTRYIYDGSHGPGTLNHLDGRWQRYRDFEAIELGDNSLKLIATARSDTLADGTIRSGMLRSKTADQYGYYEMRARLPNGKGAFPAFWINPQDLKWPPEIDWMEMVDGPNDDPHRLFCSLIGKGRGQPETSLVNSFNAYETGLDLSAGFHTYGGLWTAEKAHHIFDGLEVRRTPIDWIHNDDTHAGPAHVLANLAVGGIEWTGVPASLTHFPMVMEIDYIRVWDSDPRSL